MLRVKSSTALALALCCMVWRHVETARILGFFPSQSKSNLLVHCAIADALQQDGHEVIVVGSMPNVYPAAKYTYYEFRGARFSDEYLRDSLFFPRPIWRQYPSLMAEVALMGSKNMYNNDVERVLKQEVKIGFDLVILGYFLNDFHLGLGGKFRCPIIVSSTVPPMFATNVMVGNPHEVSYVPSHLSNFAQPMEFGQRVWNYFVSMYEQLWVRYWMDRTMNYYYKKHFECNNCPSFDEVRKNISLVFVNHHFTQGPIRPNVPNIVEIGGIQIDEDVHALPEDIELFLSQANEGAIYISFGSNIGCNVMTQEQATRIYQALIQLPFKVLWQWGDCALPGHSENILYKSWFPQNDVLAHGKVRLFITHGGQGSLIEAQYHGVPMLGIPFYGDQPSNVRSMVEKGFGLALNYYKMSKEDIVDTISELTKNQAYTTAIQRFSQLYRDRPMTPRQAVVYWANYVLRHGGAKHLQSPAVNMHFWQLWNADVVGMLLFFIIGTLLCIYKSRVLCRSVGQLQRANVPRAPVARAPVARPPVPRAPESPSQLTPPPPPRSQLPMEMQLRGRSLTPGLIQPPAGTQPFGERYSLDRPTPQLRTSQVPSPEFEPLGGPFEGFQETADLRTEHQEHAEQRPHHTDMYQPQLRDEPSSSTEATERSPTHESMHRSHQGHNVKRRQRQADRY